MIKLVVGLGNPGDQYAGTRHNAGFAYVDALARANGGQWRSDRKLAADSCEVQLGLQKVTLLKPMTFMNRSGRSVAALAGFYKWAPEDILVAHDELDLPAGVARFKRAGGHGGHNGLRDIIAQLGNQKEFYRVRIGISHPGQARDVVNYVLSRAAPNEQTLTEAAIDAAVAETALAVEGHWEKAMNRLHSFKAEDA
ncbi:MAG: aminoacyl-tRNA hydrolase [Natronospirillum sp.]|uniref:aminoacyl-tRNA hydrolase n=1 Tax=Natronospirillum sp. TaxID=2812955 RepID=UPI0025E2D7A6|nr:aminoacyl-tRNA hydrolase [Natronospirillum sp.]MCH8553012.1 aminoacyl-tRNA hydrolase [Natronospirillum sp.]